jgi:protein phosphatase
MVQALKSSDENDTAAHEELLPTWDTGVPPPVDSPGDGKSAAAFPDAFPCAVPVKETEKGSSSSDSGKMSGRLAESAVEKTPETVSERCPHCEAQRPSDARYCDNCGYVFPALEVAPAAAPTVMRVKDRYQITRPYDERDKVSRFYGLDHPDGKSDAASIILVREILPEPASSAGSSPDVTSDTIPWPQEDAASTAAEDSKLLPVTEAMEIGPKWPSVTWERELLEKLDHPFFPRVTDSFCDGGHEYLIEEKSAGRAFWDAWDDPQASDGDRFEWLSQICEALDQLHRHCAILEGLRPDIIVVDSAGRARITDLSGLLPLPLPTHCLIRGSCYTAPELVFSPDKADARADLYSFGAMLYALHLGRELTELDFELHGVPKSILHRFPDIHPDLGRLIAKTFCREADARFPTDEAAREDASGFKELLKVLDHCRRSLDQVSMEIGAWTTTGMVRSGNEDAFSIFQASESFEDDLTNSALVLLADGMGGYEAGEVAARMALEAIQEYLSRQQPFSGIVIRSTRLSGSETPEARRSIDVESWKRTIATALEHANERVHTAARDGAGPQGMGCTAEVVYLDGRNLIVGHVGDSRTYCLRRGELTQITRDHTWVNRMVDRGALTPEEAVDHPRFSELSQAIGGYHQVEPAVYHCLLRAGDWILVCSDGLSNHVAPEAIKEVLLASASAESAARRLVNFANLQGAADNVTVVVVRTN